jgi:hypothetical protein
VTYLPDLQRTLQRWRAPGRSVPAICALGERRKIAAAQFHIPQFPIVKLIELLDRGSAPTVISRRTGDGALGLEQARGGPKYTANGAADVDPAPVLNTTYYRLLAVACDAADASAEARVYLDAAIDSALV